MSEESVLTNLLDVPPAIGAARLVLLAWRTAVSSEVPLAPNQVILLPDPDPLSLVQAAARLAAGPHPLYCTPEARNGILAASCKPQSDATWRAAHAMMYEMQGQHLFGQRGDRAMAPLAHIKVLVDGRDERLTVTGEAFDRWLADYNVPAGYGGGPAYDGWALEQGLGDAVRMSRPDFVYRLSGSAATGTITITATRDLEADLKPGEASALCSRCGKPATKTLTRHSGRLAKPATKTPTRRSGPVTTELLCSDCAAAALPKPPERPSVPNDPAELTLEALSELLAQVPREQRVAGREAVKRWVEWTNTLFPDGVSAPSEVVEMRVWIKKFPQLLAGDP